MKKNLILAVFILIKFLLSYFLVSSEYELHRDEYLHLDQGQHLAFGYVSVPPLTAWISWIISILGNTVFWIKFFPALFGALTIYVVWKTVEALNGNLFALILAATGVLFSAILRINILYQPNSFDILCWTSMYFTLVKYFKYEDPKWLYAAAVVFGLGFLNKYNIGFLVVGLIPALLLTPQRKIFIQKELYFAAALALLLISPNLVWQYNNDFIVLHHMEELAKTQLVNVDRFDFLKNQLLFFIGSLFVIIAAFYALLFYRPFKPYRFFFFAIIFTLAAFVYLKAKDYYAIGLYPVYIAFGSVYLAELLKDGRKKYLQPVAIAIPIALFIPIVPLAFPLRTPEYIVEHPDTYKNLGMLRWEDGKDHELPQDFADMLGWKELAMKVDNAYKNIADKEHTLILCDNYGQAGAINYYSKQNIAAVTFNADYINWFDLTKPYKNIIRVKEIINSKTEMAETARYFDKGFVSGSIENKYAREYGTTVFVFVGAKVNVNGRLKAEIGEWGNW